jgi:lycopene cyclase CruA
VSGAAEVRARFPRTWEAFSALSDGGAKLEHVSCLEESWREGRRAATRGRQTTARPSPPAVGEALDCDVLIAGGGLSLFYAAWLARAGLRVVVCDRGRIGHGHREWNISRGELGPLAESGLFSSDEVEALILADYRAGIVRWHEGGTYPVRGVLDAVVDAEPLLHQLRARAESGGARLLDGYALVDYATSTGGVRAQLASRGPQGSDTIELTARLLVDAMGAASPHARFDLVCPTVGGVLSGLDHGEGPREVDPTLGEILVTTEHLEEGRQHVWEGFPGRRRSDGTAPMTTYLFYYAEPERLCERPLLALYERFFETLPRYKTGPARVDRATYGFIPAYSRLGPMPAAAGDRVLLVGDAAGRHSPLTFCGFGSMVRSFLPVARAVQRCLDEDRLGRRALERCWSEPPSLGVMGGLTLMMCEARRSGATRSPADINRLLDAAFATLGRKGNGVFAAFVRDQVGFSDFLSFMQETARARPSIYREVFSQLGRGELARWCWRLGQLAARQWATPPLSRDSLTG